MEGVRLGVGRLEETVWERNLAPGPGSLPTPLCRGSPVMVTTTWDSSQSIQAKLLGKLGPELSVSLDGSGH